MTTLGYRPHRAARALRTGQTLTIGVVVSTLESVGNSRMLQSISLAAARHGYALMVVTAPERGAVVEAFVRLQESAVDGAIILNEATTLARGLDVPAGLALAVLDSPPDERYTVVRTDHAAGAAAAVTHLLELGHETVHHLAGPAGSFAADERERGWRETLREAGRNVPELVRGEWTAASGHRAAQELPAEATALFAANDQMALGALRALSDAGRRVPGDVAVVGFDDIADAADYLPPLTTVGQRFDDLGDAAVGALIAAIKGAPNTAHIIAPQLVVRASTSPSTARHDG